VKFKIPNIDRIGAATLNLNNSASFKATEA